MSEKKELTKKQIDYINDMIHRGCDNHFRLHKIFLKPIIKKGKEDVIRP